MGMWNQALSPWHQQSSGGGLFDVFKETFDITKLAPGLFERVNEHNQELQSLELFRKTNATARKVMHDGLDDVIRILDTLGEFQFAPDSMQGFLVAMPEYRNLYNQNMAAGFENGFAQVDPYRGNGYMHTDTNYREITSGLQTEYDERHVWNWAADEARTTRPDLVEKHIVVNMNWAKMRDMDWEDDDPLSQLGASC
ncbi:hypothetical protein pEaSNUABM11_00037 [Erwinia phage pEa_SNUABM_11]|nr:hypothetical protein pEaSNUABM11_00037 [Erwinia phage pEa_SNUABM_11]